MSIHGHLDILLDNIIFQFRIQKVVLSVSYAGLTFGTMT